MDLLLSRNPPGRYVSNSLNGGFPKLAVLFLVIPIIRIVLFWSSYFGKLPNSLQRVASGFLWESIVGVIKGDTRSLEYSTYRVVQGYGGICRHL